MDGIERCVGCSRIKIGDRWYLEGTITAIEGTEMLSAYCPSCLDKQRAREATTTPEKHGTEKCGPISR